ncbi:permease [Martelella limonii]|uniref:permease n=1 Tax=Martelella limonii TaxID=1647649 RepID=UPI00158104D2|nr:permease [Martelella limonii]
MQHILSNIGQALLVAFGMAWKTGWTLVLGFLISSVLQSLFSAESIRARLGKGNATEIAFATAAGAASSSCSYASAAIMRTLFKKGAALVNALAFLFASTNLVIELGIILFLILGWQFMAAEWIGGLVLIALMSIAVKLTYPKKLVEDARTHEEEGHGHDHGAMTLEGETWRDRLKDPQALERIAQNFVMEWSMLWKDLTIGFLIGGFLAVFVSDSVWQALFLTDASEWIRVPVNALIGPLIAMFTFVCSIGNVPLAAVLFSSGASFGGVLAFLYADLIILPLLDAYRRYFGWKMAAYIGLVLYVTMVLAAVFMDGLFTVFSLVPEQSIDIQRELTSFSIDYTFWLNLAFAVPAAWLFWKGLKGGGMHAHHEEHENHHQHHG